MAKFGSLITLAALATISTAIYDCPMPTCDECLPAEIHDAPGIGFDLAASYGTAAVHRQNGATEDLAVVPVSKDYENMMRRLAGSPQPPDSRWRRYRRQINKALGYPSTPEVGHLSSLISDLKTASKAQLSHEPIDRIVVTTPNIESLTNEDINDAIEYAGLRSWLVYRIPYPGRISEANAAFAANGNGLCKRYEDLYECQDESESMPRHRVLSITFTKKVLHISLENMIEAFSENEDQHEFDFKAGMDQLGTYNDPSEYWNFLRQQIVALTTSLVGKTQRPITKILLLGDAATDHSFLSTVKDALSELPIVAGDNSAIEADLQTQKVSQPLYAAARGAAMYARRRQEVPWDCAEPEHCREERKKHGNRRVSDEL